MTTLVEKLDAIGDAIRAKTGGSAKLALDEMPEEIASISGGFFAYSQIKAQSSASGFRNLRRLSMRGLNMDETTLSYMFAGLSNLESVDFDGMTVTGRVTSAQNVFNGCAKIASINMSGLALPKLGNMAQMFNNCAVLESVSMPATGTATLLMEAFKACPALRDIDMTMVNTSSSVVAVDMLVGCTSLETLRMGSGWVNGTEYFATFPVAMTDENGTQFSAGDAIPSGAHTYTATQ